jgi:hypothetical protein
MKKSLLVLSLLAAAATQAQAYQTELMGQIGYQDNDVGDASVPVTVSGRYFFAPVAVNNQPHAEAWFLNRNSNAGLTLQYEDTNNVEVTDLTADVKYFVPATQFYVGGELGSQRVKVPGNSDSVTHYGLDVGYLPVNGLLLTAGLTGTSGSGNDETDGVLGAKYVAKLAGGNFYNLEGRLGLGDGKPVTIGGDYYVDNTFGIGAAYSDNLDNDFKRDGTFEVRAKKFLSPMMAIGGSVSTTDGDVGVAVNWTGRY